MNDLKEFGLLLDSYEQKVTNFLLKQNYHFVIVKGSKFIGKTTIVNQLLEKENRIPVLLHTGCNPKYIKKADKVFLKVLNKYRSERVLVIMDEYFSKKINKILIKNKNFKTLFFTNNLNFKIKKTVTFYLNEFYLQNINDFLKQKDLDCNLNINEILYHLKNQNFDADDYAKYKAKLENARISSNSTSIIIKNDQILRQTMKFN